MTTTMKILPFFFFHLSQPIFIITVLLVFPQLHYVNCFSIRRSNITPISNSIAKNLIATSTSLQCICINCARVTNCKAYHFVEKKHSQPHINNEPEFSPREGSPTIHVNIRTNRENDGEMKRLWSEHIEETRKAEEKAAASTTEKLMGEKKYDLSVKTTYEYDVVACEDFVEDNGCWVRNMPEEIKLANPDFVPT